LDEVNDKLTKQLKANVQTYKKLTVNVQSKLFCIKMISQSVTTPV